MYIVACLTGTLVESCVLFLFSTFGKWQVYLTIAERVKALLGDMPLPSLYYYSFFKTVSQFYVTRSFATKF